MAHEGVCVCVCVCACVRVSVHLRRDEANTLKLRYDACQSDIMTTSYAVRSSQMISSKIRSAKIG